MKITNKQKKVYIDLFKDGYYFRTCKYDNTTLYVLCKDLNPVNCVGSRRVYAEFNGVTARYLSKMFGFIIRHEQLYFGKGDPVANWMRRYWVENEVTNLLT